MYKAASQKEAAFFWGKFLTIRHLSRIVVFPHYIIWQHFCLMFAINRRFYVVIRPTT